MQKGPQAGRHSTDPSSPMRRSCAFCCVLVFGLQEVQHACDRLLDRWWRRWQQPDSSDGTSQLTEYACLFKHWEHLEAKQQYQFASDMPSQLQQLLQQLGTFNHTLAAHVHKWGGRGARLAGLACGTCGAPRTERHLLLECPACQPPCYAGAYPICLLVQGPTHSPLCQGSITLPCGPPPVMDHACTLGSVIGLSSAYVQWL
jgi:hypothetical protein